MKMNAWADFATPPSLLSSQVLVPNLHPFPLSHPELPPIFHQAPFCFCLPGASPTQFPPPHVHSCPAPSPLPWCPVHLRVCPSGCPPWPPVLLCFNVGPMGTGVHSKTGRACEQETGSGAGWGGTTSSNLSPLLPTSTLKHSQGPLPLPLQQPGPPTSPISVLHWSSRPETH